MKVFVNHCKGKWKMLQGKGHDNTAKVFLRIKPCLVGHSTEVVIGDQSFP